MKKLRTLLLKTALVVAAIPIAAVSWHTPLSTGYSRPDPANLDRFVSALRAHGRPPVDYVVDLFRTRDAVIVGEAHRVAQDAAFIQDLIPEAGRRAGVRRLVIEFGMTASQAEADQVVTGVAFDRRLARKLLEDFDPLWLYEEYLGLYEAAWKFNRTLAPGEEPFRIVPGTPADAPGSKETVMAGLVLDNVREGRKVLVYCGSHHAFTRYRQPMPFEFLLPRPSGRMGNHLCEALGGRVAFVQLHAPAAKRWAFFAWNAYRKPFLFPFGGVIDRAHAALGSPVAFDTSLEPFASLQDSTSYYSLHRGTPRLSDFADGYVILAPLAERRSVRAFADLGSDDEIDYLRRRYAGTPAAATVASADTLKHAVERDGLRPERNYALIDRAGFDETSWLPEVSLFWPLLATALLAGAGLRCLSRRRGRRAQD